MLKERVLFCPPPDSLADRFLQRIFPTSLIASPETLAWARGYVGNLLSSAILILVFTIWLLFALIVFVNYQRYDVFAWTAAAYLVAIVCISQMRDATSPAVMMGMVGFGLITPVVMRAISSAIELKMPPLPIFAFFGLSAAMGATQFFCFFRLLHERLVGHQAGANVSELPIDLQETLRARMHEPVQATGQWLRRVVWGYYQYHSVPGNLQQLGRFRWRLTRSWRNALRRRSQKSRVTWREIGLIFDRWIPAPRTLHPYPNVRFDARIQGRSRMR